MKFCKLSKLNSIILKLSEMTLLFVYLFIALFVSFLCSIAEAVLLSTPLSYLRTQSTRGSKSAAKFIKFKEDIDRPLSAILSLNTVAHTVGAAGVGAQATIVFGQAYFGVVSAILTLLILVFTEIIPKTLGANFYKSLTGVTVQIINIMIIITYPLVVISAFLTRLLSKKEADLTTSREEISALATIGASEGIFNAKENKIIQNLIRLKSIKISEIMTPRVVVVAADEDMTLKEFFLEKDTFHFSRIPIYQDNKDNITGYIFREMVFEKLSEDQFSLQLKDIRNDIITFTESITLFRAWEELLHDKQQISLIVDEYGGMSGVVTTEDIIETLLGFEIIDEKDRHSDMQKFALERWQNLKKK